MAAAFRTVRRNTVQVAEEIPEDKYDFVPAPGVRTVSELLRHIAFANLIHYDFHRDKTVSRRSRVTTSARSWARCTAPRAAALQERDRRAAQG